MHYVILHGCLGDYRLDANMPYTPIQCIVEQADHLELIAGMHAGVGGVLNQRLIIFLHRPHGMDLGKAKSQ